MNDYLKRACAALDEDPAAVLSYRVYAERIALVVDHGIRGCPKFSVPLSALPAPDPQPDVPDPVPDATDAARDLAAVRGLDLRTLKGTGAGGRILKADVEAVLEEG